MGLVDEGYDKRNKSASYACTCITWVVYFRMNCVMSWRASCVIYGLISTMCTHQLMIHDAPMLEFFLVILPLR